MLRTVTFWAALAQAERTTRWLPANTRRWFRASLLRRRLSTILALPTFCKHFSPKVVNILGGRRSSLRETFRPFPPG
jgi:hypothetical protein